MVKISPGVTMKALVCDRPGSPEGLKFEEVERPVVPEDGVLVRVHASSANPVDLFPMSAMGYLMGGLKRHVLGTDFAGTVEAVGKDVREFRPGDEVFGGRRGAFAEYVCVGARGAVARKPANVPFEQAGTVVVAAVTALQALRDHGQVRRGQRVLINGASGGVGTFAVQIAKALGTEVTAVCSPRNVEMVRSLGADRVIDYTREDFTRSGERYDLLVDIAGSHSWSEYRRVLQSDGTFVGVGVAAVQHGKGGGWRALRHFVQLRLATRKTSQRVVRLFIANLTTEGLAYLGELMEAGKVSPVIERTYEMDEIPAALRFMIDGHTQGKLAIRIAP